MIGAPVLQDLPLGPRGTSEEAQAPSAIEPAPAVEGAGEQSSAPTEGGRSGGSEPAIFGTGQPHPTRILATAELERLLCDPRGDDVYSRMLAPAPDSWTVRFPDLTSLPRPSGETRPLRVCIATEDIVGPVRNGGIGTTYAALAEMLAAEGHSTTILYLKGKEVETGTLEHWIEHYAAMGVDFVPVPNYAVHDGFRSVADKWLRAPYNMFRYLVEHPMDVVHVSEWRGSGYLSLLAKRQGIAFQNTLFVVKTSSPWMWNRMYGSQPLERMEDLTKVFAERRSVELADVVVGGSLHLLRWMLSQGYAVPRDRTFVQPNVVDFEHLKPFIGRRSLAPGSRTPVEEIVFFGRLEARKGLFTFCQAIHRLIRQGVQLPPKISFMGKPGARLTARPDQDILEYIESETSGWPVEVQILPNFQQQQAIEYLLTGDRLAVMPSTIENSSLAVYEAAICGIPFVASDVGGTPELIVEEDRPKVLCAPHPIPLATKIAEMIRDGGFIAKPSFDNDENLATWKRFHADLGGDLRMRLLPVHAAAAADDERRVAVCIYHTGDLAALSQTMETLAAQTVRPDEVLVAVDAQKGEASAEAQALLARFDLPCRIIETFDFDVGLAFNALAESTSASLLFFIWEGVTLSTEAVGALARIIALCGADVLNFFYREADPGHPEAPPILRANIVGSLTEAFFRSDLTVQPLFVRRETFLQAGGFTTDYRVLGYDQEFLSRAQLSGLHCETALVELATVNFLRKEWLYERCYDQPTSYFRAIRPQLATVPLALRDLLLLAKGLSASPSGQKKKKPAAQEGDSGIGRVMRAIGGNERAPAPKPGPASGKSAPIRHPASVNQLMQLLDEADRIEPRPGLAEAAAQADVPEKPAPAKKPQPKPAEAKAPKPAKPAAKREKVEKRVLCMREGMAYGWVLDKDEPAKVFAVEALREGTVVASAQASNTMELGPHIGRTDIAGHAFALNLFPGLGLSTLRGGSAVFDFRIAGTETFITRGVEVFSPAASMKNSPYDGFCEPNDNGTVQGWVWTPDNPEQRIDVDVFVDDVFIGRTTANNHREDLVEAGISSGYYGFRLQLPPEFQRRNGARVSVVVSKAGLALKRSPLVIRDRRLELLPSRLGLPDLPLLRLGRSRFSRKSS